MEEKLQKQLKPALYLVPTPIGNLGDITLRAVEVLRNCTMIACEDTRRTGMLLKSLEIPRKLLESYFNYNEKDKAIRLIEMVREGSSVALITDAGSPCISDPGYRIVERAIQEGVEIIALPGATAFVPALSASGFAVHAFKFFGFAPQKKGRATFLQKLLAEECTTILYESPNRIEKLLKEIAKYSGETRRVCVAREISKIHEEYIRGSVADCLLKLKAKDRIRGEFVLVVEGNRLSKESAVDEMNDDAENEE